MWQDKYVALTKGINLGSPDVLDGDDLQVASNLDWDHDGTIKGRPSRATPPLFFGGGSLVSSGEVPLGITRLRDVASERPALATNANLYSLEGGHWSYRGQFACAKADRLFNYRTMASATEFPFPAAPDFAPSFLTSGSTKVYTLLSNNSQDQSVAITSTSGLDRGQGARCGTTTAVFFRRTLSDPHLYVVYRTAGAAALTQVALFADVDTAATVQPVACCSHDATSFFVVYPTSTANTFRVAKIGITGTVIASSTFTQAGVLGLWLDNTNVATNRLVVGFTTTSGITLHLWDQSPAFVGAIGTIALGGATSAGECVVGCTPTGPAYWAYKSLTGTGDGDINIGTAALSSPGSVSSTISLYGGGTYPNAGVHWGLMHQPVCLNGRMYLTLAAAAVTGSNTGTWVTVDITSNVYSLVARGPSDATVPWSTPLAATTTTDGQGFLFHSGEYSRFSDADGNLVGLDLRFGLNRVALQAPRTTLVGETTVFSGSVPHHVQRGGVTELGFPFLAGQPAMDASVQSGGAVGIGSYTVAAIWRWTDETGAIHRSAPSPLRTVTTSSGQNTIQVTVANCQLSEKNASSTGVQLEIYCTDINPTSSGALFLQTTTPSLTGTEYTTVNLTTQPLTTTEKLYTEGGAFAQYHVPADGGVAAMGRRLWIASGSTVFASKLISQGWAPGFNDEGQLQVNIPPGAGRILSLEALSNRLLVFCSRGVFAVTDGGPDNVGDGPDFGAPERLADLGIAHPRGSCWTPKGVVFAVPSSASEAQRGGPWIIGADGGPTWIGKPILDYCQSDSPQQVCYCPEREAVFLSYDQRSKSNGTGYALLDLRSPRWAVWANRDAQDGVFQFFESVNGDLWTVANEAAPLNGTPGVDAGAAGAYTMTLGTAHLYVGNTGLGWGRVRSVRTLAHPSSGAHTLTYQVVLDQFQSYTSSSFSESAGSTGTTWPSSRQAPEWRLPTQKCSSIQVLVSASPATAVWSALGLRIAPTLQTAPAAQRQ